MKISWNYNKKLKHPRNKCIRNKLKEITNTIEEIENEKEKITKLFMER